MATLTKKEIAWLNDLQAVLDRCPSPEKIGFYSTGDCGLYLYNLSKRDEVFTCLAKNRGSGEFCGAVYEVNADIPHTLTFPSPVESTAG